MMAKTRPYHHMLHDIEWVSMVTNLYLRNKFITPESLWIQIK